MEIRAYSELYIESAQNIAGHMFDFAINEVGLETDEFATLFSVSKIAAQFERGNPTYVAGKTGPELVELILIESGMVKEIPEHVMYADRSPQYWAGWALSYYQWYRNLKFYHILKAVPFSELIKMYKVYHEMDMSKFVEEMNKRLEKAYPETELKRRRELIHLSQKELSEISGVPLRQIQLFEQRQRDLSKTQAATLLRLGKALGCSMEDLIRGE